MLERAAPLVEQVRQQLLRWIRDETLASENGSLPSESELAERLAVSRATVRDALAQLERDRVVTRRHGAGTYVNPSVKEFTTSLDVLREPASLIEAAGHTASVGSHSIVPARLTPEAAAALDRPAAAPALAISVSYLADGRPAIWLEGLIPVADPSVSPPPFAALAQFVSELTGQIITHSIATLEAVSAGRRLAQRLALKAGQPLICLIDVYLTAEGSRVFYSQSCIAPGLIPIQVLRKTDSVPRPGRVSIW